MDIRSPGAVPTRRGPSEWFSGTVWQDTTVECPAPAWHTQPLGQTLVVLSGSGLTQTWGGPLREIRAGDTVWIPPGEKHWHGASPTTAMVHVAMQEALDGKHVEWMEQVSQEQYAAAVAR